MKKNKPLVFAAGIFAVGIVAFLMIFMFGRKAYGNTDDTGKISMESSESAEEKVEDTGKKMNEVAAGGDNAIGSTVESAIKSSESDEEKVDYVDQKMNEALTSDRYSKMSLEERRELASGILLQLEQDGYITGVLYSEDGFMYSFEYSDGTLGGWCIKDFSAQDGVLPTN